MSKSTLYTLLFLCAATFHLQAQDTVRASTLAGLDISAEKYYNSGIGKIAAKDYQGAINEFNQAISINGNFYQFVFCVFQP